MLGNIFTFSLCQLGQHEDEDAVHVEEECVSSFSHCCVCCTSHVSPLTHALMMKHKTITLRST